MNIRTFFAACLFIFFLILSCETESPVISSIDPKIGRMGEVITLTGSNFGEERNESYVTIAGISPTNSSYSMWKDDTIVVRVPELGESGLVYVHVEGRKSNGVLFSNSATVPRPVEGEELGLQPRITSVTPPSGAPGSLITIAGSNFGVSRENSLQTASGIFLSWDFDSGAYNPYAVREPEFVEVSEIELGYESWNSREIRFRIPDGAVSGNIEVRTPHGRSRPVFFDVTGKPGTKTISEKRSYTVTYSVDIKVLEATRPNTLYLWMPKPVTSPSQRNVSLISRNMDPFIENYRGTGLYKLDNLSSGTGQSINLSYSVEVYSVQTAVRYQSIRRETSALSAMHTQSSEMLPSDNQTIRAAVNSIIGREQNPYLRARVLYDWIITNIDIAKIPARGVITAFEQRQADPCAAALLYTTMARAAGIPCVPAAGVLIDRNLQTTHHYWAEFWIDGFGWVPVDPVMGSGAVRIESASVQSPSVSETDYANYYFGNIDNQRITFSRGELVLSQMEARGRIVSRAPSYSTQNIWEEATGGLESYSSLWGDIIISGIYIQ